MIKKIIGYLPYKVDTLVGEGLGEVVGLDDLQHLKVWGHDHDEPYYLHIDEVQLVLGRMKDMSKEDLLGFSNEFVSSVMFRKFNPELMTVNDHTQAMMLHLDVWGLIDKGLAVDRKTL